MENKGAWVKSFALTKPGKTYSMAITEASKVKRFIANSFQLISV